MGYIMSLEPVSTDIQELRQEATEARQLAAVLNDAASVCDLLKYAEQLEADVARLDPHSGGNVSKRFNRGAEGRHRGRDKSHYAVARGHRV